MRDVDDRLERLEVAHEYGWNPDEQKNFNDYCRMHRQRQEWQSKFRHEEYSSLIDRIGTSSSASTETSSSHRTGST